MSLNTNLYLPSKKQQNFNKKKISQLCWNSNQNKERRLKSHSNKTQYEYITGWKYTLYLWHARLPHGATDTPPLTRGYILQQSAVVLNGGLPNLYNSHSEGCKVAVKGNQDLLKDWKKTNPPQARKSAKQTKTLPLINHHNAKFG